MINLVTYTMILKSNWLIELKIGWSIDSDNDFELIRLKIDTYQL